MKIVEILVHNYKSVCSNVAECRLRLDDKVTFLIGANESGKTNILEAMTKFSLGGFDHADIPQVCEWRGKPDIPDDLMMVSVTFAIEDSDRKVLTEIHPILGKASEVTITRNYGGEHYISSPDLEAEAGLNKLLSRLGHASKNFATRFRTYIKQYKRANKATASPTRSALMRLGSLKEQIDVLTHSFDSSQIASTRKRVKRLRIAVMDLSNPLESLESDVIKPLDEIAGMVEELPKCLAVQNASQRLWDIVPKFEFVSADPTLWLAGEYWVDDILNEPETEKLASVRRLLRLSGLDLQATRELKDEMQRSRLEQASRQLTDVIRGVWKQEEDIQIILDWSSTEGNKKILVMIDSTGHRGFPQYRSYGLRWFLEFYLLHAVALRSNVVLLFEEPGIHLHPDAQEYLKRLIREKVADKSQVVYTTHLTDMYDLAYPEGCRAIEKDVKRGGVTIVETQYSPEHQYATWEVAMRAVGISRPILRVYTKSIIVEGPADWIYLLTLAQVLAIEEPKLSDTACGFIHIRHYQGASGLSKHVPFHFQPGAKSVIVLDSDEPGEAARQRLESELHLPNEFVIKILMVNEVENILTELGEGHHELEDLFGRKYYAALVSDMMGKKYSISEKDFQNENLIAAQAVKLFKKKYNIDLRKDDVAWHFRKLAKSGDPKIPEQAKALFKSLLLSAIESL